MERRRASRRSPAHDEPLARIRLRAGGQLVVIDVSPAGVLVEGATRLLPGTHVDVHVITGDGRTLVRSRVVRAYVWDLRPDRISYRGALAFDRAVDTTAGYPIPGVSAAAGLPKGTAYPDSAPASVHGRQDRFAAGSW